MVVGEEGGALFLKLSLLLVKLLLLQIPDLSVDAGNCVAGSRRSKQLAIHARGGSHGRRMVL